MSDARASLRPQRPRCQSGVVAPRQVCSRTCWSRNLPTFCRYIARARSTSDPASNWNAPRWPIGSGSVRDCCARRSTPSDTPVPVLAPGAVKTKQVRLWAKLPKVPAARPLEWRRRATCATKGHMPGLPLPPCSTATSPDRRAEHPRTHLAEFKGVLHADGYTGFDGLYESARVVEAACWAHVRRKFFDLHATGKAPLATEALTRVQALYAIEAEISGRPPDERRRARQIRAGPLLADMKTRLEATLPRIPKRGDLAGPSATRPSVGRR